MPSSHPLGSGERRGASTATGTGQAHGKAVLFGEHAVVHGAPAVAVPLPALRCRATAILRASGGTDGFRFILTQVPHKSAQEPPTSDRDSEPEPGPHAGLQMLAAAFTCCLGLAAPPPVDVLLRSGIPEARGLGSSAAVARAAVQSMAALFGAALDRRTVFELVQVAEQAAHGSASGIDALATGTTAPVLLDGGRVCSPPIGADVCLVVADSGTSGSTREAVALLAARFARAAGLREEFVAASTTLTRAGLVDLADGRTASLGRRLTDCHVLLQDAGLTTFRIDSLVRTALEAGALGAKMTGGGLGGCVIALADGPDAARDLAAVLTSRHGAPVWITPVRRDADHDTA